MESAKKILKKKRDFEKKKKKYENYNDCGYTKEQQDEIKKVIREEKKIIRKEKRFEDYTKEQREQIKEIVIARISQIPDNFRMSMG